MNIELSNKIIALCYQIGEPLPVVKKGTPAFAAWEKWRLDNDLSADMMNKLGKATVPVEYPPDDIDTLLRTPKGKRKTRDDWKV